MHIIGNVIEGLLQELVEEVGVAEDEARQGLVPRENEIRAGTKSKFASRAGLTISRSPASLHPTTESSWRSLTPAGSPKYVLFPHN